jgi:hypothetical protein
VKTTVHSAEHTPKVRMLAQQSGSSSHLTCVPDIVRVAVDAEVVTRLEHAECAPAPRHLAIPPVLDVPGVPRQCPPNLAPPAMNATKVQVIGPTGNQLLQYHLGRSNEPARYRRATHGGICAGRPRSRPVERPPSRGKPGAWPTLRYEVRRVSGAPQTIT